MGWCFSLHVMPERGINDLDDWLPLLKDGHIENEYGERVSYEDMIATITERQGREWSDRDWSGFYYRSEANFHVSNNSERGPNGLLRHKLGRHCVKHGAGTWDCITGEFS